MNYNKGEQITARMLRYYLSLIHEDTPISIGLGDVIKPVHYLSNVNGILVLVNDLYMVDAEDNNLKTVLSFIKR